MRKTAIFGIGAGLLSALVPASAYGQGVWDAQRNALRGMICPAPGRAASNSAAEEISKPLKVFDNLYRFGNGHTSAWALTTPDGIILLEAMFHHNVIPSVESGLREMGLDPAQVKYVIVTHAHNDHFGGARHFQDKYGAQVVMSERDWSHLHTWPQIGSPAPYPRKDLAVADGQRLTLGGTTVRFVSTPGHTPGTMSLVFDVKDGAKSHRVGYWGASSVSFLPPTEIAQYMSSADLFKRIDKSIDVPLSNHPAIDGVLLKAPLLKQRKAGEPHPFVSGNDKFREWAQEIHDCAGEVLDSKLAANN
jgi:metallo-beta-lactamase class B